MPTGSASVVGAAARVISPRIPAYMLGSTAGTSGPADLVLSSFFVPIDPRPPARALDGLTIGSHAHESAELRHSAHVCVKSPDLVIRGRPHGHLAIRMPPAGRGRHDQPRGEGARSRRRSPLAAGRGC